MSAQVQSAHSTLPLHSTSYHLYSHDWHQVGIKPLSFVLWSKGTAMYLFLIWMKFVQLPRPSTGCTSMHQVIIQRWVNYHHALLHYHSFMHSLVSFYFHYNRVSWQLLSVPEVTLILGSSHKHYGCVVTFSGYPAQYATVHCISYPFALQNFAIFINAMPHLTNENAKKKKKNNLKMCIIGYVHSVINTHIISMQIMLLKILTISITSAYYLLRCNSSRHPAGV